MKFNIPELGTTITLAEDWRFALHHEHRNKTLFEILNLPYVQNWRENPNPLPHMVTMPKGTVLKVDRIYIRKGLSDYSSVTFLAPGKKTKKKVIQRTGMNWGGPADGTIFTFEQKIPARGVRFWVKLFEANAIVFEEITL